MKNLAMWIGYGVLVIVGLKACVACEASSIGESGCLRTTPHKSR